MHADQQQSGVPVDLVNGCTITQLCPCAWQAMGTAGSWENHREYVLCVTQAAEDFMNLGLITDAEEEEITAQAAGTVCGTIHILCPILDLLL